MIETFCAPCILPLAVGATAATSSSIKKKEKFLILFNIINILCIIFIMIYICASNS